MEEQKAPGVGQEQAPEGARECYCPVCGQRHWMPYGRMRMKHMMGMRPWGMMPMGLASMGLALALLGFFAGVVVGGSCRR